MAKANRPSHVSPPPGGFKPKDQVHPPNRKLVVSPKRVLKPVGAKHGGGKGVAKRPVVKGPARVPGTNAAGTGANDVAFPSDGVLTNRRYQGLEDAAARTKFQPLREGLAGQDAQLATQQSRIPNWYQQYQQESQGLQGKTQAAYDAAQADIQRLSSQSSAVDQGVAAGVPEAKGLLDAASRSRDVIQGAQRGVLLSQGASAQDLSNSQRASASRQQLKDLVDVSSKRGGLGVKLSELRGQEGDFRNQFRDSMRQQVQKSALENAVFNLDQTKAAVDARDKDRDFALKGEDQKLKVAQLQSALQDQAADNSRADRQLGIQQQNADSNSSRAAGAGAAKPLTPLQRRGIQQKSAKGVADVQNTVSKIRSYLGLKDAKGKSPGRAQVIARLRSEKVPDYMLNAAGNLLDFGFINPKNVRQLAGLGIVVPKAMRVKPKSVFTKRVSGRARL